MKKVSNRYMGIFLVIASCLVPLLFITAKNHYNKYAFERMLKESKYVIEEKLPNLLKSERLVDSVSCTFASNISDTSWNMYCYWTEHCEATFYVDDEMDRWSDSKQYEFISKLEDTVEQHIQEIMTENYTNYNEYDEQYGILYDVYGKRISYKSSRFITVKTSNNTYRYSGTDNFYWRNEEGVDLFKGIERKKKQMPYIGMAEAAIGSTSLGEPTTKEKCKDFDLLKAARRWTEYRWYEGGIQDLMHLKCIAKVWYYDYEAKKEVPGYVYDVTIYD